MWERVKGTIGFIREYFAERGRGAGARAIEGVHAARGALIGLGLVGGAGYLLYLHPPMKTVGRGEAGIRINRLTGEVSEWRDGSVFVMPGMHELRVYSLRDHSYRPSGSARADGPAPLAGPGLEKAHRERALIRRRAHDPV